MGKQTTEWDGAEPSVKDFDAQADEILNSLNSGNSEWSDKGAESDKKTQGDGSDSGKDKEPKDWAWKTDDGKKQEPDKKDENKIPLSRLNKEIGKVDSLKKQLERYQKKEKEEQERLKWLTDDEREEQENFTRLWMDTKMSRLQEKIEEIQSELSEKDEIIKELKSGISEKEKSDLSSRIQELTKTHDWSDGLPKFDIKDLMEYMKEEGYYPKDPLKVYQMKYASEIYAKKYQKSWTEPDKGNKWGYAPTKKNISWGSDDFDSEADAILKWVWGTT